MKTTWRQFKNSALRKSIALMARSLLSNGSVGDWAVRVYRHKCVYLLTAANN